MLKANVQHAISALAVALSAGLACHGARPAGSPPPGAPVTAAAAPSATQQANDRQMQAILTRIGAQQNAPAEQVFVNLQIPWLRTVPARTFLSIMNGGYAKALGVGCEHCHVTTDFASDDKRPKKAAREMAVMHRMINQELAKMQHIATPATQNRAISCIACHRGMIDPR